MEHSIVQLKQEQEKLAITKDSLMDENQSMKERLVGSAGQQTDMSAKPKEGGEQYAHQSESARAFDDELRRQIEHLAMENEILRMQSKEQGQLKQLKTALQERIDELEYASKGLESEKQ